jgi:hypothetical protein
MPQMKGLKELTLLVSNKTDAGWYGGIQTVTGHAQQHPPYQLLLLIS